MQRVPPLAVAGPDRAGPAAVTGAGSQQKPVSDAPGVAPGGATAVTVAKGT